VAAKAVTVQHGIRLIDGVDAVSNTPKKSIIKNRKRKTAIFSFAPFTTGN